MACFGWLLTLTFICHPRGRGDPESVISWIPACAGMTTSHCNDEIIKKDAAAPIFCSPLKRDEKCANEKSRRRNNGAA